MYTIQTGDGETVHFTPNGEDGFTREDGDPNFSTLTLQGGYYVVTDKSDDDLHGGIGRDNLNGGPGRDAYDCGDDDDLDNPEIIDDGDSGYSEGLIQTWNMAEPFIDGREWVSSASGYEDDSRELVDYSDPEHLQGFYGGYAAWAYQDVAPMTYNAYATWVPEAGAVGNYTLQDTSVVDTFPYDGLDPAPLTWLQVGQSGVPSSVDEYANGTDHRAGSSLTFAAPVFPAPVYPVVRRFDHPQA